MDDQDRQDLVIGWLGRCCSQHGDCECFFARSISDGISRARTYDAQGMWNMKTETELIVTHALDQAIAGVVRSRYHQIMLDILGAPYEEGTDAGIASEKKNVLDAVNSLHENLRRLQPPAYDNPLVPLFYSAWYQPFQINLAYSLIMMIAEQRHGILSAQKTLQVVDFGCGSLATYFAFVLAVLDLTEQGYPVPSIQIDAIDSSFEMMRVGAETLTRFKQNLANAGINVDSAFPVNIRFYRNHQQVSMATSAERWLTVFHAFYRKYQHLVQPALAALTKMVQPTTALMTGYRGNGDVIKFVSPFGQHGDFCDLPSIRLSGGFEETTTWRRSRAQLLPDISRWKGLMLASAVEWTRPGYDETIVYLHDPGNQNLAVK
jgi:hypothetical protein